MSTISTEQAKDLRNAFECWQQDYDSVEDKEQYEMFGLAVVAMDELLALRKERERAEPAYYLNQIDYGDGEGFELRAYFRELDAMKSKDDFGGVVIPAYTAPPATDKVAETAVCPKCGNTGLADSGGVQPWGEPILIECDCTAPPAPTDKPKSEMSQQAEQLLRDTTALAVTLSAETDTTPQQFESLAFKSVVPAGWKLVPIEPTMQQEYAGYKTLNDTGKMSRLMKTRLGIIYRAMLSAAPEPCK